MAQQPQDPAPWLHYLRPLLVRFDNDSGTRQEVVRNLLLTSWATERLRLLDDECKKRNGPGEFASLRLYTNTLVVIVRLGHLEPTVNKMYGNVDKRNAKLTALREAKEGIVIQSGQRKQQVLHELRTPAGEQHREDLREEIEACHEPFNIYGCGEVIKPYRLTFEDVNNPFVNQNTRAGTHKSTTARAKHTAREIVRISHQPPAKTNLVPKRYYGVKFQQKPPKPGIGLSTLSPSGRIEGHQRTV